MSESHESQTPDKSAVPPSDCEFREVRERFICPNDCCDGAEIQAAHRIEQFDEKTGVRTIRAYHEGCGRVYRASYRLYASQWTLVGNIELVTDEAQRKGFFARLDHLRGVGAEAGDEETGDRRCGVIDWTEFGGSVMTTLKDRIADAMQREKAHDQLAELRRVVAPHFLSAEEISQLRVDSAMARDDSSQDVDQFDDAFYGQRHPEEVS